MYFPECFPENFTRDILPVIKTIRSIPVYRVVKYGKLDKQAFLSSYEEVILKLRPQPRNFPLDDPGTYSTSCNESMEELEYKLTVFMKHQPKAFIAKGDTVVECGPSQITRERKPKNTGFHVDWWIYRNTTPELYFEEVKNESDDNV